MCRGTVSVLYNVDGAHVNGEDLTKPKPGSQLLLRQTDEGICCTLKELTEYCNLRCCVEKLLRLLYCVLKETEIGNIDLAMAFKKAARDVTCRIHNERKATNYGPL